jgi:hypothetical protein
LQYLAIPQSWFELWGQIEHLGYLLDRNLSVVSTGSSEAIDESRLARGLEVKTLVFAAGV